MKLYSGKVNLYSFKPICEASLYLLVIFLNNLHLMPLHSWLSGLLSGQLKVLFSEKSTQKLPAAPIATKVSALTSSSLPQ